MCSRTISLDWVIVGYNLPFPHTHKRVILSEYMNLLNMLVTVHKVKTPSDLCRPQSQCNGPLLIGMRCYHLSGIPQGERGEEAVCAGDQRCQGDAEQLEIETGLRHPT